MTTYYTEANSPIGPLLLVSNGQSLTGLYMQEHKKGPKPLIDWVRTEEPFEKALAQLKEYFAGARKAFALKIRPQGTAFQEKVWQALLTIPYGETITYSELAQRVGSPQAVRAVGAANGRNPISIIVPCHRVIGMTGKLVGYAGGTERKRWLLGHEGAIAGQASLKQGLWKAQDTQNTPPQTL